MIAYLSGKLVALGEDHILVEVNGVGYLVHVGTGTLAQLPPLGSSVRIYTYLALQDTEMRLYGFTEAPQRELFQELMSVSGIGPKMALTIVSSLPFNTLLQAITQEDVALLTQIPGVGIKLAQRITLELRERVARLGWRVEAPPTDMARVVIEEVVEALLQLGFTSGEARRAATLVVRQLGEGVTTEAALKAALQKLGQS